MKPIPPTADGRTGRDVSASSGHVPVALPACGGQHTHIVTMALAVRKLVRAVTQDGG